VKKLLAWRHPGFSTFVGRPIPPEDAKAIEHIAGYVVRNPVRYVGPCWLEWWGTREVAPGSNGSGPEATFPRCP